MAYSALAVSQYIIDHEWEENKPVSNLRLQKLLYFIQGYFYMCYGHRCFDDKIEAWDFGPVIPNVYREYKVYGSCIIITRKTDLIGTLSKEAKERINEVLEVSRKYSTSKLVDISKKQSPWAKTHSYCFINEITEYKMKEYFCEPLDKNGSI